MVHFWIALDSKTISDKMIDGYHTLNDNISNTINIIQKVETASKEQLKAIEQINHAINGLDQQTQQNANIANETQKVADSTSSIANKIIEDANQKEFEGKNEIKIPELTNNTKKVEPKKQKEIEVKKTSSKAESKVIKSNVSDDEWESF